MQNTEGGFKTQKTEKQKEVKRIFAAAAKGKDKLCVCVCVGLGVVIYVEGVTEKWCVSETDKSGAEPKTATTVPVYLVHFHSDTSCVSTTGLRKIKARF